MALVGMKIIKNFLPKPLLDACVDDFRSKLNTDCWSSSNFAWKPFLRQGVHGSTIATAIPKVFSDEISRHLKPHAPEFKKLTCDIMYGNQVLVLEYTLTLIICLVQHYI